MIEKIKQKCEAEIEWVQRNIDEGSSTGADGIWLAGWMDAHKDILEMIEREPWPEEDNQAICSNCGAAKGSQHLMNCHLTGVF